LLDGAAVTDVDGCLLSGLSAFTSLHPDGIASGSSRLAELSRGAVRYGQQLRLQDRATLARRLYGFNCAPCSPAWRRRLPSTAAVTAFLRLAPGDSARRLLDAHWSAATDSRWIRCRAAGIGHDRARPFKLYVSPHAPALPATLGVVIGVFAEAGVASFKVARTLPGILRPDALVAYAERPDQIRELAAVLDRPLAGMPAQGVPFTGQLDRTGLLSWGADPIDEPRVSRRGLLADRLATALIAAGDPQPGLRAPWECALYRLALDGVDIATWEPTPLEPDPPGERDVS
jgi:hypothetical protein